MEETNKSSVEITDELIADIRQRLRDEEEKNMVFAISVFRSDLLSILNKRDIKVLLECENLLFALAFCDSAIDEIKNLNHNADEFSYPYSAFFSLHQLLAFLDIRE